MNNILLTNFHYDKGNIVVRFKGVGNINYMEEYSFVFETEKIYPNAIDYDDRGEVIITFPFAKLTPGIDYSLSNKHGIVKIKNQLSEESHERAKEILNIREDNLFVQRKTQIGKIRSQITKIFNFKKASFQRGGKIRLLYWLTKPYFWNKRIILFSERSDTFADNSSTLFFQCFNRNADHAYYLTEMPNTSNKINKRKYIKKDTLKHILYYLNSDVCVNAYDIERYMSFGGYGKSGLFQTFGDLLIYKKVFLQHGVFYNDISFYLEKNRTNFDLVVISTAHEYKFLKSIGYLDNEISQSGLPRFIKLQDLSNNEKQSIDILIMPTWRTFIKNKEEYINSNYYKNMVDLCNRVYEAFPNKDIVFFQHYEFQKYNMEISQFINSNISVLTGNEQIQGLLKNSKVLITDYSSVMFDFIYMNKPVISFQFDREDFFSKHTNKPIIEFKELPLITVETNVSNIVPKLVTLLNKKQSSVQKPYHLFYETNDKSIRNLADQINNL